MKARMGSYESSITITIKVEKAVTISLRITRWGPESRMTTNVGDKRYYKDYEKVSSAFDAWFNKNKSLRKEKDNKSVYGILAEELLDMATKANSISELAKMLQR